MYKTSFPKLTEIKQDWYVIDADGIVLGRLASQVAAILRGKNKPYFTPHLDTGDFVVIINADKIRLTGRKAEFKTYFTHSGYLGSERFLQYKDVLQNSPEKIVERAIKGMLPHNALGRQLFRKLKVYRGPEHPHQAQQPKLLAIEG
ncbi:MAG: 50S ribosomal protein L13 [Candidatus Marinimicrobia bacterium]|nr:50S ribosomal protein L13 [Candidatus Neomarinimicrobiota bacterium]MCK9483591.1 50S ribosomal protein L13 [Candidatus Neomarinimicrobiota bacterium]MDD5540542.1 50S ribosomal protein L13 [Candidatus Neomarinimicrobiota bacterium]